MLVGGEEEAEELHSSFITSTTAPFFFFLKQKKDKRDEKCFGEAQCRLDSFQSLESPLLLWHLNQHQTVLQRPAMSVLKWSKHSKRSSESIYDMLHLVRFLCHFSLPGLLLLLL